MRETETPRDPEEVERERERLERETGDTGREFTHTQSSSLVTHSTHYGLEREEDTQTLLLER